MEDSEKLTALKKAYADIILNTAKEAAARIMVSERKAMLFQQELASTKDESLRMLLRLKQMLDSKVIEAETTSLSQQKKIEELEAQLQEAEEIVRDLRAELREVQAELEKVRNNQRYPTVEQNIEGENRAQEKNLQDNPHGSLYSVSHIQCESVRTYDTRNSYVNGTNEGFKCCVSNDHVNKCYLHNPDFASIVIRRKEPELYQNGCTQRIHAFERSLFGGSMSLSQNIDGAQNETLVRGDEEHKGPPATINGDLMHEAEKLHDIKCEAEQPDELEVLRGNEEGKGMSVTTDTNIVCGEEKPNELELVNGDIDNVEMPVHKQKKKILKKRKGLRSRIYGNRVKKTHEGSYLSCTKNSPHVVHNNDQPRENSSKVCENEAHNDLSSASSAKVPIDTTVMIKQSGPHNDSEREEVFLKVCSDWNKINDDKELLDKSDLTKQESLSTESLEVPACRADGEATNDSSNKLGQQVSDTDEKVACQSVNDKFLKYTFRRKRKKDSLSSPDVDYSLEKCSLKKKCGEKQNIHTEPQKSCTITESSRDSRRLAQVARQDGCKTNKKLISLSEKKWWQ